jgi:(p)ppGpp synthase/HD superfamily hydrolase
MSPLDSAIAIAAHAHAGQTDKAGRPYILHPLRLMLKIQSEAEMIVAVLHDVVEDSSVSLDDLRDRGFAEDILAAIDCLSKRAGEPYEDFIARITHNSLARKVKIEDIRDNLDLTRIEHLEERDLARAEKYHRALKILLSDANTGTNAQ